MSALHDLWGALYESAYGSYPVWFNLGTMVPAATVSYLGLINTSVGYGVVASDAVDRSYW